jgi:hypothetical protein
VSCCLKQSCEGIKCDVHCSGDVTVVMIYNDNSECVCVANLCCVLRQTLTCRCHKLTIQPMEEPNETIPKCSLKQYTVVRKVLKCDNHFRILGVTRQASPNTIRRQWKRLSLLVHPDKNPAPGAEEAFKSM